MATNTSILNGPLFDLSSVYGVDRMPKTPTLQYYMYTPNFDDRGLDFQKGVGFIPGEHPALRNVSLTNFEFVDPWAAFDEITMVFEDPDFALANCPALVETETRVKFAFGYTDMMSPVREMIFYRREMDFPESGRVTTKLMFFSAGIELGLVYQNLEITSQTLGLQPGLPVTLSQVAAYIARMYSLTPVIEEDDGITKKATWTVKGQTLLNWLEEQYRYVKTKDTGRTGYVVQVRNHELRCGTRQYDKLEEHSFTYRTKDSILRSFRPSFPADLQRGGMWLARFDGFDPATGERRQSNRATVGDSKDATTNSSAGNTLVVTNVKTNQQKLEAIAPATALKDDRAKREAIRNKTQSQLIDVRKQLQAVMLLKDDDGKPLPIVQRREEFKRLHAQEVELLRVQASLDFEDKIKGDGALAALTPDERAKVKLYHADRITPEYESMFQKAEAEFNISQDLLKAIASYESGFSAFYHYDKDSNNPITGRKGNASYGMMHLEATTAYHFDATIYDADTAHPEFNTKVAPPPLGGTPVIWPDAYYLQGEYGPTDFPNLRLNHQANIRLAAKLFSQILQRVYTQFPPGVNALPTPDTYIEYALSIYNGGGHGSAGGEPYRIPRYTDAERHILNSNPSDPIFNQQSYVDPIMAAWRYFKGTSTDTNENSFAQDPNTGPNMANMQNMAETSFQLAMTATIDLWGYPLIATGQPIGIYGVPTRFGGRWFVKETRHKLDRGVGFTTSCDLSRYPPGGTEDTTNRGAVKSGASAQVQTNARTNDTKIVVPTASGRAPGTQKENINSNGKEPGGLPANYAPNGLR